ncbi:MAG: DUF1475 family protein [Candidatus Omnitrophica bacterium]|nr:DUF1475 family protein [Candidatus Omnitrophota bacterium]
MNNKWNKLAMVVSLGMSVFMVGLVIVTSLQSNLLEALPRLNQEPWFVTTIVDFYFNIALISFWILYKEKSPFIALIWIFSFICLGSITTAFYVFLQFFKMRNEKSCNRVLLREGSL